jgi:hypothetical protein
MQERKPEILLTGTDTVTSGIVVALLEKMVNTTNWELKLESSFRLNKRKLLGNLKLGVVALLEKIVNGVKLNLTGDWELEPNFCFQVVIAFLIAMKLVFKKKRKPKHTRLRILVGCD